VGALLDHLARARAVGELEGEGIGGLDIRSIESLVLFVLLSFSSSGNDNLYVLSDQIMHINGDALSFVFPSYRK